MSGPMLTTADVAARVLAHPLWSNRRIADELGLHHSRIAPIRERLEASGQIARSTLRQRRDGAVIDTANIGRNRPPRGTNGGVDLTGKRFGRLMVIGIAGRIGGSIRWLCSCDCGKATSTRTGNLMDGHTVSCGCYAIEVRGQINLIHGRSKSREHMAWINMRQRCNNANRADWAHYGGRGITVCPEWSSFERFFRDMGPAPVGHSLDRIDVNGNYEPSNCRWASSVEQMRNTRANRLITFQGQTLTLKAWSEHLGIKYQTLHSRLKRATFEEIAGAIGVGA